jgi:pilus assembly protein Flp/PilA
MLTKFLKDESGATAIEYGILAGLISVAIIATVVTMGESLTGIFTKINTQLTTANTKTK